MTTAEELSGRTLPYYGLIAPISIPSDGKIPDVAAGVSSREEYDRYFRIVRDDPELMKWSLSCLEIQQRILDDLDTTELSAEDQYDILAGCVVILISTLKKWVSAARQEAA